jgi:hypothetical protein
MIPLGIPSTSPGCLKKSGRRSSSFAGAGTFRALLRDVLNAYFAATGKRIRSVPLKNQDITFV